MHHSCDRSCPEYKTARQHGCYEGTLCDQHLKAGRKDATCAGQIFDCTFVEADMKICLSVSSSQKFSVVVRTNFIKSFPRVRTTLEDDMITLNMILVDVLEENHAVHILRKLSRGGNIGFFHVTIVFAIARSQTKTLIDRLVFIQWFQISEETSKIQHRSVIQVIFYDLP